MGLNRHRKSPTSNRARGAYDSILLAGLHLEGQVDVLLVHGHTLVDGWSASYSWDHHYLRFIDQERRTFYRVRFANQAQGQDSELRGH